MVVEPDQLLERYVEAGCGIVIVHAEACTHLHRTLARIRDLGATPGLALNPHTPAEVVAQVCDLVGLVLVMTVNPGFGGQTFIPEALDKVKRLYRTIQSQGYVAQIEVDGGVKADWTAQDSVKAGATILVAGTAIFNEAEPVTQSMARMHSCVHGLKPE